jgi:transcriptional regulator with XRE-family HTH domain
MSENLRVRMMQKGIIPARRNVFAENFEMICKSQGIKEKEVAARAGMPHKNLSAIKAYGNPRYGTVLKLARALGIDPGLFFEYEEKV